MFRFNFRWGNGDAVFGYRHGYSFRWGFNFYCVLIAVPRVGIHREYGAFQITFGSVYHNNDHIVLRLNAS